MRVSFPTQLFLFFALIISTNLQAQVTDAKECGLYIPNIFSPNNDGANDEFKAQVGSSSEIDFTLGYTLEIFGRNGSMVFSSSDVSLGWDGKINGSNAAQGVYV